jgi:CLIP-associating protein 1/2
MKDLTDLIKAGNRPDCKWNENFKNVLFCLFNHLDLTLNNTNENTSHSDLAMQTLCAFRELLQFQYKEFSNYIELTLMKLIDKYRDTPPTELTKLIEETIYTAARCLPAEACTRVLRPLIETGDYPKNLMAIKMLQKTIQQQMSVELCNRIRADLIKSLLISWENKESPVRRQSVLCIVDMHAVVGDCLFEHLTQLSSSKMKLLKVYINRRMEENSGGFVNSSSLAAKQQKQMMV